MNRYNNEKSDVMETLKERLGRFHEWTNGEVKSVEELNKEFLDLAKWFLYGGHIEVCNEGGLLYKIHIHAVEFYFHCEVGCKWGIKDPIVYHSNLKRVEEEIKKKGGLKTEEAADKLNNIKIEYADLEEKDKAPYFPLMTLNAHSSGYDITFESEEQKYRASALIREYIVFDKDGGLIEGNCEKEGMKYDNRSTYLYDYINGFSISDGKTWVKWVDKEDDFNGKVQIDRCKRDRVKKFKVIGRGESPRYTLWGKDDNETDDREWKFTRKYYPNGTV